MKIARIGVLGIFIVGHDMGVRRFDVSAITCNSPRSTQARFENLCGDNLPIKVWTTAAHQGGTTELRTKVIA